MRRRMWEEERKVSKHGQQTAITARYTRAAPIYASVNTGHATRRNGAVPQKTAPLER